MLELVTAMTDPRLTEGNVTSAHDVRIYPSSYRVKRWGRWWRPRGYYDIRCNICRFVRGPLTEQRATAILSGHDAAVEQTRFVVIEELRRMADEFAERGAPKDGLVIVTWGQAADLLRERASELAGASDDD
jgi:hypothetical protein